ncbi:hypothetical protein KAR48_09840 [bacterium]|nr:hypothetical protein [bacterium]
MRRKKVGTILHSCAISFKAQGFCQPAITIISIHILGLRRPGLIDPSVDNFFSNILGAVVTVLGFALGVIALCSCIVLIIKLR